MAIDRGAAAQAIDAFLRALGHTAESTPDIDGTGQRVADAWIDEILDGYRVDVTSLLQAESAPIRREVRGLVILRDSEVVTMCPHHLMPAIGLATVAYDPGDRLAGIGALARTVDALAHRLTLQETIGDTVVATLIRELGAAGAYCRLSMRHGCLTGRGERKGAMIDTIAAAGTLASGGEREATLLAHLSQPVHRT